MLRRHVLVAIVLPILATDVAITASTGYGIALETKRPAEDANRNNIVKNTTLSAAAMRVKAKEFFDQGKFQAVVDLLDAAIKLEPRNAESYDRRGWAYFRLGQYPQTIADTTQALALDPKKMGALIRRGLAYLNSNDNGRALADFNTAGSIDPASPGPFTYRGLVYSSMGEHDLAIAEIAKAIKINPDFGEAYGALGDVYLKRQQYEKALIAYNKAVPLQPHNAIVLNGRANAYRHLNNTESALADVNEALKLSPNHYIVNLRRGEIYLAKGNYEAAVKDFTKALSLRPKSVSALLQRARAYELSQRLQEARADLKATLDLFPTHGAAIAGIDRIDMKLGVNTGTSRPVTDHAGVRTALVIGNSKYSAVDALKNSKRDADLIAGALRNSGFSKVQLLIDGTRESMTNAINDFAEDAGNADWAVIYYAGHGIELDGSNYLVPIDVKYDSDADIPKESIALDQIINVIAKASKLRLVILDACRDNPFIADMKGLQPSATGRGLARIEPGSGTLVAFATKHGSVATDGIGENSPFASAIAKRIEVPGIEISQLFRLVHDDVFASTNNQQEPFTYGQLSAEAYFFRK